MVLACLRNGKDEASMTGAGQAMIGREGGKRVGADQFLIDSMWGRKERKEAG